MSVLGVFLVCIFPHSNRLRRYTGQIFVFIPNTIKHGPGKLQIRTVLTQRDIIRYDHIQTRFFFLDNCDDDGIDIKEFEANLQKYQNLSTHKVTPKKPYWGMVYLLTQLHNPKGTSYSEGKSYDCKKCFISNLFYW